MEVKSFTHIDRVPNLFKDITELKSLKNSVSCYVKEFNGKMGSPTPSSGSIDRTHSLGSLIDQNEYHSLSSAHSPLTASPTSLSSGGSNTNSAGNVVENIGSILVNGHHHLSANGIIGSVCGGGGSSSSASSTSSSSSGCGGLGGQTISNQSLHSSLHSSSNNNINASNNGHNHHHLHHHHGINGGNTNNASAAGGGGNNLSSSSSLCGLCHGPFVNPKVLPCLHTFCEGCLERNQEHPGKITCSRCQQECILTSRGVTGLLPDFTVKQSSTSVVGGGIGMDGGSMHDDLIGGGHSTTTTSSAMNSSSTTQTQHCTSCHKLSSTAIVHCVDCNLYLCQDCLMAHTFANFDGHRIMSVSASSSSTSNGCAGTTTTVVDGLCCDLKDEIVGGNGVVTLNKNGGTTTTHEKRVPCPRHKTETLKSFCVTCNVPICNECATLEHPSGLHEFESLTEAGYKHMELVNHAVQESKTKANDIRGIIKNLDHASNKLHVQFQKAQNEVNDTFHFYRSMLEERKQEILKELEGVFSAKQLSINVVGQKAQETVEKIYQMCDFIERLSKHATMTECLLFKKLLDSKLQGLMSYSPDISLQNASDLEFVSNYQAIQVGVRNTFGYVRSSGEVNVGPAKQPPIARPVVNSGANHGGGGSSYTNSVAAAASSSSSFMMSSNGNVNGYGGGLSNGLSSSASSMNAHNTLNGLSNGSMAATLAASAAMAGSGSIFNSNSLNVLLENRAYSNGLESQSTNMYESPLMSKRFGNGGGGGGNTISSMGNGTTGLGPFSTSSINDLGCGLNGVGGGGGGGVNGLSTIGPYEKWSNGGGDIFQNGNDFTLGGISNGDVLDITSKLLSTSIFPPKSQIKRQKMIYHCKFGEFGALEAQFTEPSGVAVNAANDIIVADTNNHRIQIFDKEGRFRFQFGECGKRDGQLLYPNRVAVVKHTGDIIVTERSPTHQIQIYNQYGQFLRKFGATILQHPRGITVDHKGRIVVVECKVMRVIIFDQMGTVLQKFGCSKHLEFPNGVVVNDHQEIFISDNRAHCVKVFNYDGQFLRQIGSEGITNYPIGVGINAAGEILIADNHNNFNLTIFTQDGQLVSALESKVKHAQCFDVALMDDGSVVLASKDYRLYIYRYVQIPPIGL